MATTSDRAPGAYFGSCHIAEFWTNGEEKLCAMAKTPGVSGAFRSTVALAAIVPPRLSSLAAPIPMEPESRKNWQTTFAVFDSMKQEEAEGDDEEDGKDDDHDDVDDEDDDKEEPEAGSKEDLLIARRWAFFQKIRYFGRGHCAADAAVELARTLCTVAAVPSSFALAWFDIALAIMRDNCADDPLPLHTEARICSRYADFIKSLHWTSPIKIACLPAAEMHVLRAATLLQTLIHAPGSAEDGEKAVLEFEHAHTQLSLGLIFLGRKKFSEAVDTLQRLYGDASRRAGGRGMTAELAQCWQGMKREAHDLLHLANLGKFGDVASANCCRPLRTAPTAVDNGDEEKDEHTSAGVLKYCGRCGVATYCSEYCQKLHWRVHKKDCHPKAAAVAAPASPVDTKEDAVVAVVAAAS